MQINRYIPMSLIAVAILSGCGSTPKNESLLAAHVSYNEARNNPQVMILADAEFKEAGDSLNKADQAFNKGESEASVNHLAYIAKQQVRIAQETVFRKTDESTVTGASAKRNELRLEVRTSEVDAATAKTAAAKAETVAAKAETAAAREEMKIAAETAMMQSEELAAANANAQRDQAMIAQQAKLLKDLNAKQTKRGLVVTLGDVLFSTSKADMKAGGALSVQKLADFLNQFPHHKVLIEGYTDSTGNSIRNQDLSERRASAVRSALMDRGIGSDRIATRGYGAKFPVINNSTPANRQLNRRVEIIISDNNGNIAVR